MCPSRLTIPLQRADIKTNKIWQSSEAKTATIRRNKAAAQRHSFADSDSQKGPKQRDQNTPQQDSLKVSYYIILINLQSARSHTKITAKRQPPKETKYMSPMKRRPSNAARYESSLFKCDSIWIVALQMRLDVNRCSSNATRYESSLFKYDSIWIVALQIRLDMNRVFKWNNIMKNHHPHLASEYKKI